MSKEELTKTKDGDKFEELSDDKLNTVTGGFSVNQDGTYSFAKGEKFISCKLPNVYTGVYEVMYDYPSISYNATVLCFYYEYDPQGFLITEDSPKTVLAATLVTLEKYSG